MEQQGSSRGPLRVVVLQGSGDGGAPSSVHATHEQLHAWGAQPGDLLRLHHRQRTLLLALHLAPADAADADGLQLDAAQMRALSAKPLDQVDANVVSPSSLAAWDELSLVVAPPLDAFFFPTETDVRYALTHRVKAPRRPWRIDCTHYSALLPSNSKLELQGVSLRAALECEVQCSRWPRPRRELASAMEALELEPSLEEWGLVDSQTHIRVVSAAAAAAAAARRGVAEDAPLLLVLGLLQPQLAPAALAASPLDGSPERTIFDSVGGAFPVLLSGALGVGKSARVAALCDALGLTLLRIEPHQITSEYGGAFADAMRQITSAAKLAEPCVILLDDVHALAPSDINGSDAQAWSALTELVGLARSASSKVVFTCPSATAVHARLRDACSLEVTMPMPKASERAAALAAGAAARSVPPPPLQLASELALASAGFARADLDALVLEACSAAEMAGRPTQPNEADWRSAVGRVRPVALANLLASRDALGGTRWDDVGGLDAVKRRLRQLVQWPLSAPRTCAELGLAAPRGVLLYGPPGTGKTLLVRALASESGLHLLAVSISRLIHGAVGASERAVAELFELARSHTPCLLFLDELQALFGRREGGGGRVSRLMLSQLLLELDASQEASVSSTGEVSVATDGTLVVIGATNTPAAIDDALLRPGRLEYLLLVPPPCKEARRDILRGLLRRMPLAGQTSAADDAVDRLAIEIAAQTERFSGADLRGLCQRAGLVAVRRAGREVDTLTDDDFAEALRLTTPSIREQDLAQLDAWEQGEGRW